VIDIYYRSDLEGGIKIISHSIYGVLGYMHEEVLGKNVIEFHANKDARKELLEELEKSGEVINFNTYLIDKNNMSQYVSANVKYVYDEKWSPIAIDGFLRDMTDQHLFEEALRESESRYKMFSNLTIEAIILHNNGIYQM
jgi:two-component system sporulation sensor kinase A